MRNFNTFQLAEENDPEVIVDLNQVVAFYEEKENYPGTKTGPKIAIVLQNGHSFLITCNIGFKKFKEWFFEELDKIDDEPEGGFRYK